VNRRWQGLFVVLTGQFMASLDTTIGNVAAPAIERELGVAPGTAALAVTAYTLMYASCLITGARLGADRGRRRMFLVGVGVFTVASTTAGAAPDAAVLVGARAVQGLGAALAIPQVISLIQADFTGVARARALTAYSVMIALGGSTGLAAGGWLIDLDVAGLGWRSVFLVNLPIGVLVLAVATRTLPRIPTTPRRLDGTGVALLTTGAALLTGPLALAADAGINLAGWVCLATGAGVLAVFWSSQHRRPAPLLDPAIVATPGVRPGLAALFLTGTAYTGTLFCVAAELQQHRHSTALQAGLALLPFVVGYGVGSLAGAVVPPRHHTALILGGVVLLAGSLVGLGLGGPGALLAGAGLGYGCCFAPTLGSTVRHVEPALVADASGIATTTFQFSFVVGVAVFGTVYASVSIGAALLASGAVTALAVPAVLAGAGRRHQHG
jgi:MFS family permease